MLASMVTLSDEDAAAIQRAYDESGALSAAIEVTRRFQAITGERARGWARMICAWKPVEAKSSRIPYSGHVGDTATWRA
jgi:hypothetical protein